MRGADRPVPGTHAERRSTRMSNQPPQGPPDQPAEGGRWLQDPSGRWQFIPDQQLAGPPPPAGPPQAMYGPPPAPKRGWLRRHPYWSVGIVFVVLAAAGTGGGVASSTTSTQ